MSNYREHRLSLLEKLKPLNDKIKNGNISVKERQAAMREAEERSMFYGFILEEEEGCPMTERSYGDHFLLATCYDHRYKYPPISILLQDAIESKDVRMASGWFSEEELERDIYMRELLLTRMKRYSSSPVIAN